ncbi:MAG: PAS domain S-box protein [Paludibacter sp.]|nr:PAS domain S-box protein [Paludibacter sp.]
MIDTPNNKPEPFLSSPLPQKYIVLTCMYIILAVSILNLGGWASGIPISIMKGINGHLSPMMIDTAICFILCAGSLYVIQKRLTKGFISLIPKISGVLVFTVGVITSCLHIAILNHVTEKSIMEIPVLGIFLAPNNNMALVTAGNFVLIGMILFLVSFHKKRLTGIAHALIFPSLLICYMILVSYILGIYNLHSINHVSVALSTAISFCAICLGILFIDTNSWFMKVFTSSGSGGLMARRLLPGLIVLPIAIAWFRILGEKRGIYESEVGVAFVAITYTVCFIFLTWLSAKHANKIDKKREMAEDAIRESELRHRLLSETMLQGVVYQNAQGKIISMNPASERILGKTMERFLGSNSIEEEHDTIREDGSLFPGDEHPAMVSLRTGESLQKVIMGVFNPTMDEYRWISINSVPLFRTGNEKPSEVYTIFEDITNGKRAVDALHESELRLKYHFENSPLAVVEWDHNYMVTQWSIEAERMFGWKKEETIGKPIGKLNLIYEEDIQIVNRTMERLNSGVEDTVVSTNRNVTKSGAIITTVWYNSILFEQNGGMKSVMSLVQDITQQKQAQEEILNSERKLSEIYDNMSEGLAVHELIFDPSGKAIDYLLTEVNPAYENITGLKRSEIIGKRASEIYLIEKAPYLEIYSEVESTGISISFEAYFPPMDKHFSISVFSPGKGRFVTVFKDMTERKKAEEELEVYRKHLEELVTERTTDLANAISNLERSNKELEEFAYVASHDLQEPLRMVSSYTQLLERRYKDKLDQDANDFIFYAVDGANRMQKLINDLLEYSRVSSQGKVFLKVDSSQVLGQAISNLQNLISDNLALVTNEELPVLNVDETQIVRVFQNLIENAIKYKKKTESPKIHISCRMTNNMYEFSVHDNGIGIEMQYHDRIFIIFQRLHKKDDYPGTGIGLSVSKRIIERHGGTIWFESKKDEGTTFYFTIPA